MDVQSSALRTLRGAHPGPDPTNLFHAVETLWTVTIHALAAWLLLGSIATGMLYLLLVPVLSRMRNQLRPATGDSLC